MALSEQEQEIVRQIFTDLEEHNAGWDGIMINAYWTKIIEERYGCSDIKTLELGVNVNPFEWRH
jgi:hypothetical protein